MILNKLKIGALICALGIVASTMTPGIADAGDTFCAGSGTDCHVIVNGIGHDLREVL